MNPSPPSTTIPGSTTLGAIRAKVRRLTLSPSEAQLTTAQLDEYINTYVVYDFPETLRTFNLKTTFEFITNPGQDVYNTDIASFGINPAAVFNPLYNFQNKYLTVHPPFYAAGFPIIFTQLPQQFWAAYPMLNAIASIGVTGNGGVTYTGVINTQQTVIPTPGFNQLLALVQRQVMFNSINAAGQGIALRDVPVIDIYGNPTINGNLYDANSAAYQNALQTPPTVIDVNNTINYVTGVYTITFPSAPAIGATINSQTIPYQGSRPQCIMYYSNTFTLRPIPDQSYRINFEVFQRPTALLAENQSPELEEYWQLIALGAAKKVLQDRMDVDTMALIQPELDQQELLCLRRTIVQLSNQRSPTIYSVSETGPGYNNGWGNWPF